MDALKIHQQANQYIGVANHHGNDKYVLKISIVLFLRNLSLFAAQYIIIQMIEET